LLISAWVNSLWIILATIAKAWFIFLSLYGIFIYRIVFLSSKFNIQKFSSVLNRQLILKIFFLLGFLNLAGLPPFSGFFMKLYILKCSIIRISLLTVLILLYASLTVLFSYLIISFYIIRVSTVKNTVNSRGMRLARFICFFSFFSFPLLSVFSL
jgi:formate hydrogenlyase subunit 3/multisubunit Na+/H+ antiporter MnhD subunit